MGRALPRLRQPPDPATAWAAAARPPALREPFAHHLQTWCTQHLLRRPPTGPAAPSRLALFAAAAETHMASAGRRFPLRSPFPLQRPVVFYPGLDTREIHDPRRFPWVAQLEAAFPVIQEEFHALRAGTPAFSAVHRAHTSAGEWAAAYLWAFGQRVNDDACRLCPETVRLLRTIPGVAQFGTTLYSALAPRSRIAPHHGFSNAKLRCQLPLLVPGPSRLRVGDSEIDQIEGRAIVFDDSFLHSAWNDGDQPRFVLVFDLFHPDLTVPEIVHLSALAQRWQLAKPVIAEATGGDTAAWAATPEARP